MNTQFQQPQGYVTTVYTSTPGHMPVCHPPPAVPPAVVQPPPKISSRVDKYQHRQSVGLGVTLIVFGVAAIVLNGVGFALSDKVAHVSHGFYCGAWFILTGAFGIAAVRKNKCLIVTFMVLAILTSIITIEMLTVGVVGSVQNSQNCGSSNYGYCSDNYYHGYAYITMCVTTYSPPCSKGAIAIEALLAIVAFGAAIVSIWGSAICCRAVCCCRSQPPPSYGVINPSNYGNPQIMVYQQQSSNFAYGPGQQQAIAGYCHFNPATQQYQYNYWASPAEFQSPFSYPIGVQAAPADSMASTTVAMATAPPGYVETLAALAEADKK